MTTALQKALDGQKITDTQAKFHCTRDLLLLEYGSVTDLRCRSKVTQNGYADGINRHPIGAG